MRTYTGKSRSLKKLTGKIVSLLVSIVFLGILVGAVGYFSLIEFMKPVAASEGDEKKVFIPRGANSKQIGGILSEQGLVRSGLVFRLYVKGEGLDGKLQAGEYILSTGMSTQEIAGRLTKGETADISFTIPEGFTLKQIADKLEKAGLVDRDEFMELAANGDFNHDFLRGLPKGEDRLEGYLFPDTYKISSNTGEKQILQMMLDRFAQVAGQEFRKKAEKQGLTLHQAVILASIVEREAVRAEERPQVAAVFLNRLKKGWKLESCATVQFALGVNKPRLLAADLKIDSPYNTYKHPGLPAGPIASPGKPSLEAVVNPAKVDYMFFVVYEDGKHVFSRTLEEHNKSRAIYLNRLKKSQ